MSKLSSVFAVLPLKLHSAYDIYLCMVIKFDKTCPVLYIYKLMNTYKMIKNTAKHRTVSGRTDQTTDIRDACRLIYDDSAITRYFPRPKTRTSLLKGWFQSRRYAVHLLTFRWESLHKNINPRVRHNFWSRDDRDGQNDNLLFGVHSMENNEVREHANKNYFIISGLFALQWLKCLVNAHCSYMLVTLREKGWLLFRRTELFITLTCTCPSY